MLHRPNFKFILTASDLQNQTFSSSPVLLDILYCLFFQSLIIKKWFNNFVTILLSSLDSSILSVYFYNENTVSYSTLNGDTQPSAFVIKISSKEKVLSIFLKHSINCSIKIKSNQFRKYKMLLENPKDCILFGIT